jgi:hypothetical protein
MSRDSPVSKVIGHTLDDWCLIPSRSKDLSLCHPILTGCGTQPVTDLMGFGVQWPEHRGDRSPLFSVEVKNAWS